MSDPKVPFHPQLPHEHSSGREIVPPPPPGLPQVVIAGGRPSHGGGGQELGAQFVLDALRRWWKIALPLALLLAPAAVAMVYVRFEPQYEASTLLEIHEHPQYIAFETGQGGGQGFFRTQMELIRSRWILGLTAANDKVKQLPEICKAVDPIEWLKKRVTVVQANGSNVFEIKYTGADAEAASTIVNELTRQYLTTQEEEGAKSTRDIVAALTREMELREKEVHDLQNQVRVATQEVSGKEPEFSRPDPASPFRNPLGELQNRLIGIQVDRTMLTAKIAAAEEELRAAEAAAAAEAKAAAKAGAAATNAQKEAAAKALAAPLSPEETARRDVMVEQALAAHPEVRQLEGMIRSKRMDIEDIKMTTRLGEKDSLCQNALKQIAVYQKSIDSLKHDLEGPARKEAEANLRLQRGSRLAAEAAGGRATPVDRKREELAQMQSQLQTYELAEKNVRATYAVELKKYLTQVEQCSEENLLLGFKKDELAQKQKVLERIAERQIALQTERGEPPQVVWHEPAKVPIAPVELVPYKKMTMAGLLALLAPFGLAIGWESLTRRIGGSEDLERQLRMQVMGEIARLPMRRYVVPHTPEMNAVSELRVFEESIDSLRTALTLSDSLRDMRVLAITSAASHEGKTSVASQLAISLARASGKPTLLIDGDMRSPDVHRVFGIARGPGLAEVLNHQCLLGEAIVKTANPNVYLLPAGRLKVSPHRLLGNGAWKAVLEQLPTGFRYVIIDTPPVLAASEALVLAKSADAALLCVMRDVSRTDQVRKASDMLYLAGGHPIGTVLNGVPVSHYKYRYGVYPTRETHE